MLYVREGRQGLDRVLLDPAALGRDATTALDWFYPSPDGRLLAYGLSEGGSEQSTLRVRDVATGADLSDTIPWTRACSLEWLPDGSGFVYTRYPEPGSVPRARRTTTGASTSTRWAATGGATPACSARDARRKTGRRSSSRRTGAGWR